LKINAFVILENHMHFILQSDNLSKDINANALKNQHNHASQDCHGYIVFFASLFQQ
jgi:REP element-mobilizing transposase RayT